MNDCPKEGNEDGEGPGEETLWGIAEVTWFVQCREEETDGRPRWGFQPTDGKQRGRMRLV